jgi:hypothetical protein
MTQAGGSAAMNGMLYQVLGCVGSVMDLSFSAESLESATLIIEPKNGGDLQIYEGNKRKVEQWKAKSNKGTWSLICIN